MRYQIRLMCPGCFKDSIALVGEDKPQAGDIAVCACGAVNIYDGEARKRLLRKPTSEEALMIQGNENYQRLVSRKKGVLH